MFTHGACIYVPELVGDGVEEQVATLCVELGHQALEHLHGRRVHDGALLLLVAHLVGTTLSD